MKPKLSYTIWFSQRTGSTLLCEALASTGIAGKPGEWLLNDYGPGNVESFRQKMWAAATSPDGIFGLKIAHNASTRKLIGELRGLPDCPKEPKNDAVIWDCLCPNGKHLFMTRRNKVRLAVSWWRAIKSDEWHRKTGDAPKVKDLRE